MRLPEEAGLPEGVCGQLNKAMYGCRDAAGCWEIEIADFFTCNGFTPGLGSPVLFVNMTRDLQVSIHGDDVTSLGFEDNLQWLRERLSDRYELKFGGMLGPDLDTDVQDVSLLNRLIHFGANETTVEADPRHVQILKSELGLGDAKTVTTPGVSCSANDSPELSAVETSRYRSMVMRCNYLALDRPDICYASKELARNMQKPRQGHFQGLKRLVRYLSGRPRLVWVCNEQMEQDKLRMYTDSDDAGCHSTRKSTSSGALFHGQHLLKFYSTTQHVISLSSGESEFYAGIKAGATLLGAIATMQDFGLTFKAELLFDATAAKAMLGRRGHGRAKHISRCYLWLQQRIAEGEIALSKVGTSVNPTDVGTKHLDAGKINALVELMNMRFADGCHQLALRA